MHWRRETLQQGRQTFLNVKLGLHSAVWGSFFSRGMLAPGGCMASSRASVSLSHQQQQAVLVTRTLLLQIAGSHPFEG